MLFDNGRSPLVVYPWSTDTVSVDPPIMTSLGWITWSPRVEKFDVISLMYTDTVRSMSTGVGCVYVEVATPSVEVRMRTLSVSTSLNDIDQLTVWTPLFDAGMVIVFIFSNPSVSLTCATEPSDANRIVVHSAFG